MRRVILGENGAFAHDWKARVGHPLSQRVYVNRGGTLPRKPPSVVAKDVGPGDVHTSREWRVTAAPAEHVQPLTRLLGLEARSLPELALRFCLTHPAVSTVIPGMRTQANVRANVAVSDGRPLSEALMAELAHHAWMRNFYD